jgi:hypothetical protein
MRERVKTCGNFSSRTLIVDLFVAVRTLTSCFLRKSVWFGMLLADLPSNLRTNAGLEGPLNRGYGE